MPAASPPVEFVAFGATSAALGETSARSSFAADAPMVSAVGPILADLVEVYLRERQRRGEFGLLTVRNQRSILGRFAKVYGARPVDRLSRRDVQRWQEKIGDLKPAGRATQFSAVRSFCAWLRDRGHIRRDPFAGLKAPRRPRAVPRALSADAVGAALDAAPDARARLMVMLMVQETLRCCEVERLELGDIDRPNGIIRVRGKGGHERVVRVTEELAEALDEYLDEHPASAGPLVRSYRDPTRPLRADTISGIVSEIFRASGVKRAPRDGVSAHALRHTAATDMLRRSANPRDVQYVMGHAHLQTLEIYLPLTLGSLDETMGGRRYRRSPSRITTPVETPEPTCAPVLQLVRRSRAVRRPTDPELPPAG